MSEITQSLPIPGFASDDYEPCIAPGEPFSHYRSTPAASSHGLMEMLRSPAHYLCDLTIPKKETPSLLFGRAVHLAVFERGIETGQVVCAPECDRRTKDGKAIWNAFIEQADPSAVVLKQDDFDRVQWARDAVLKHPLVGRLVAMDGYSELSVYASDREDWLGKGTGLLTRARLDRVPKNRIQQRQFVLDLKTTMNATYDAFVRQAYSYKYDLQCAHYVQTWSDFVKVPVREIEYVLLAVETEPPFAVNAFLADEEFLEFGFRRRRLALDRLAKCVRAGGFPAYSVELRPLGVPKWASLDMPGVDDIGGVA